MNTEQFLQLLHQDGFPEPVEVQQIPNGHLEDHEHLFEVRALVMKGSITIITNSQSKVYKAGDIFQLSFKQPHAELYGPEGVTYLASGKQ